MNSHQAKNVRSNSLFQLPDHLIAAVQAAEIYHYDKSSFIFDLTQYESSQAEDLGKDLTILLTDKWEGAKAYKVFNYSLNCMYKLLEGNYNLSIQLNTERGVLRRKPLRFRALDEPFSPLRWNFTKLKEHEILLMLRCTDRIDEDYSIEQNIIAVNASPLERGHSLVIPSSNKCLPQLITPQAIRMGTEVMLMMRDRNMHILFNSLLGQASVNHLHMHLMKWPYESDLIYRRFTKIAKDLYLATTPSWFIQVFAIQLKGYQHLDPFLGTINRLVGVLIEKKVAHNFFFTRAPPIRTEGEERVEVRVEDVASLVTLYVFPRKSVTGAKPPTNFNPAALELAGCMTAYTYRFFEAADEVGVIRIVKDEAVLEDQHFESLKESVLLEFAD
uniref:GDP-D-glucose phosphorylase 1 n=1 Tax=Rhabditophanes sp. KR3021 TaxID=114890 RepID=A0AC35TQW7_9BILA